MFTSLLHLYCFYITKYFSTKLCSYLNLPIWSFLYIFKKYNPRSPKCTPRAQECMPRGKINLIVLVYTQEMSFQLHILSLFKKNARQRLQLRKFCLLTIIFRICMNKSVKCRPRARIWLVCAQISHMDSLGHDTNPSTKVIHLCSFLRGI